MAKSLVSNPGHWRNRAEETRLLAADMLDPVAKETMLRIAMDYDQLARRAEERSAETAKPRGSDP